jgi:hypothetical protein
VLAIAARLDGVHAPVAPGCDPRFKTIAMASVDTEDEFIVQASAAGARSGSVAPRKL